MQGTTDGIRDGRTSLTMPDILAKAADRLAWMKTSASSALGFPDDYGSQLSDENDDDYDCYVCLSFCPYL